MYDFNFVNPTRLIFGRGVVGQIGAVTAGYGKRALLVTGRTSARESGAYDTVIRNLEEEGIAHEELPGILPNPRLAPCIEGAEICKNRGIEVVIGLGGGSVLDSAKAIAAGACYDGDLWDFFEHKAEIAQALPVIGIMTVAATGSEYNRITVVKNEALHRKAGLWNEHLFPKVSLIDPELTFSVSARYTAYGGVDIISHVLERYLSGKPEPLLQLRFKEVLITTVMESVEKAQAEPTDYEARSTLMWASSLACSGLFDVGVMESDIPAHIIDTEAAGFSDHAHGAGLAVLLPAVMRYYVNRFPYTIARFAAEVMGVKSGGNRSQIDLALAGIVAFRAWLDKIGCPITLKELGIEAEAFEEIARRVDENEEGPDYADTMGILRQYER
jgi:alcohol dehydrogenase YqhD (iron-dependent ADH family)